jgi:hypothetical protein
MRAKRSAALPSARAARMRLSPAAASGARPTAASRAPPSETVTRSSRGSAGSPSSTAIASATSSALPAAWPSTWFMSVIWAVVGRPASLATVTSARASDSACSREAMKAPEPVFTSSTSASRPAASFFDRIEATISPSDSTVAVTSRTA